MEKYVGILFLNNYHDFNNQCKSELRMKNNVKTILNELLCRVIVIFHHLQ